MDLYSVGHTFQGVTFPEVRECFNLFHGMTDPLGIQILHTLKTIALQYREEADINLIEKIRIGFYIPQWKLDILQDIYFTTPEQFLFFMLLSAYYHVDSLYTFLVKHHFILSSTYSHFYKGSTIEHSLKWFIEYNGTHRM